MGKATEPTETQSKMLRKAFKNCKLIPEKESIGPGQMRKTPLDDGNSQAKCFKNITKVYERRKHLKMDQNLINKTEQAEKLTEPTEEQSKYVKINS